MGDFLISAYPWIKSLHIISVMAWMAGMLYLPRLFVYHADAEPCSDKSETFKVMERRLLRAIMNPAMIATFIFGGLMLGTPGLIDWGSGWIWVKLAAVLGMAVVHHVFASWRKEFAADTNTRSASFYKMCNEVPTVFLFVIVVMVVVRPF